MDTIKKYLKKIVNSIPFNPSALFYFLILLYMPIANAWIVEQYPLLLYPITILFLIALLVVLQKLVKKHPETFTSIFLLYIIAISSMTRYADPWTIPLFTAYVVNLANNLYKFHEEKKKK